MELKAIYRAQSEAALPEQGTPERADLVKHEAARQEDLTELQTRWTTIGTPRYLLGPGFRINRSHLNMQATSNLELAKAFLAHYARLWRVTPDDYAAAEVSVRSFNDRTNADLEAIDFKQMYRGVRVVGGRQTVLVKKSTNEIVGVLGSFAPMGEMTTSPALTGAQVCALVSCESDPELVVWSGHLSGDARSPRLAYQAVENSQGKGLRRTEWLDAETGEVIATAEVDAGSLHRSVWDRREYSNYGSCRNWGDGTNSPLGECNCMLRPPELCPCPLPNDLDPLCARHTWRYDDAVSSSCQADGVPRGEGPCSTDALNAWQWLADVYEFWAQSYGRDSWDGMGGFLFASVNNNISGYSLAQANDVFDSTPGDGMADNVTDVVQLGIAPSASEFVFKHEAGHALQFGTSRRATIEVGTFRHLNGPVHEGLADIHANRSRGLTAGVPGLTDSCQSPNTWNHYSRFHSREDLDANYLNAYINLCNAWMMHQTAVDTDPNIAGYQYDHHGVRVTSFSPAQYDQVWYAAQAVYTTFPTDLFDWWYFQKRNRSRIADVAGA